MPSDITPLSFDFLILKPPGNFAPGRATATRSPTLKLVAPQTMLAGSLSSEKLTEHTLNRSASGWLTLVRTSPTTT